MIWIKKVRNEMIKNILSFLFDEYGFIGFLCTIFFLISFITFLAIILHSLSYAPISNLILFSTIFTINCVIIGCIFFHQKYKKFKDDFENMKKKLEDIHG